MLPPSSRRAFSLVELIVAIVVLGVLAALTVPAFAAVIDRSRDEVAAASWEALGREAQALAAFDSADHVTDDELATALADLAAASGDVAPPAGSWTRDRDGQLDAGEYVTEVAATTLYVAATDSRLAAAGRAVHVAIPASGAPRAVVDLLDADSSAGHQVAVDARAALSNRQHTTGGAGGTGDTPAGDSDADPDPATAPTNLVPVAGDGSVLLSFAANPSGERIGMYTVTYGPASDPSVGSVDLDASVYCTDTTCRVTIDGLAGGVEHRFVAIAINTGGVSEQSTAVFATPADTD